MERRRRPYHQIEPSGERLLEGGEEDVAEEEENGDDEKQGPERERAEGRTADIH